jgi:hypothetical protein
MTATRYTYTDEQDDTLRIEPRNSEPGVYIGTSGAGVYVKPEDAARVAAELLKAADMSGVVLPGELPEVKEWDNRTVAVFGGTYLVDGETAEPAFWFERAKINLAIAHYLSSIGIAAKEAETKLAARRDAVYQSLKVDRDTRADTMVNTAVDRIIALEDKLAEAAE